MSTPVTFSGTVTPLARALVRSRVEAQMSATVTILRGTLGTLNPATGVVYGITGAQTIYSGKARIHTVSGEGSISLAAGQIDQRQTVVSIPWDAPMPQRDDIVLVGTDDLADPDLDNKALRVIEVSGGTAFGDARRLSCTAWGDSRYWNGT